MYSNNQNTYHGQRHQPHQSGSCRKKRTNKWLSEQLGVGQATVSKWVQNNAQPNLEMLIKISKLLNVDINELIRPDEVQID